MRSHALAAFFLLLFLLPAAACGGSGGEAAGTAPSAARQAAPEISGTTVDGDKLSLADLRGEPVLVNVWSSW